MALSIDIKANDAFQKSALETADALDRVAALETRINASAAKIGAAYKSAAGYAQTMSASTSAAASNASAMASASTGLENTMGKAQGKALEASKKVTKEAKKKNDGEKGFLSNLKKGVGQTAAIAAGLVAAGTAAAALGYKIADTASAAYDSRREAAALLNAWTGQRGPKAMQLIDGLASQLGMRFDEAREKFLQFRESGLNNKMSAQLLKLRADLMATGLSAESADKEIARVTSVGHDVYARARALQEIQRSYGGIGSGAKAATYATVSLAAAQNKLSNVTGEVMADLWKEIGPHIGKAAHTLSDFAIKLIKSDDGKAAIVAVGDAFKFVASVVTSENLTTGLNVVKALVQTIGQVFEFTGKAAAYGASKAVEAVEWITEEIGKLVDLAADMFPNGVAIVDGLIDGITSRISAAAETVAGLASKIASGFAEALGIQSPSKVFAAFGRNTVEGFEQGERQAIGSRALPLQEAASEQPEAPVTRRKESVTGSSGWTITIEQLIVQGGGDPDRIARSVRQELQALLSAGAMSRGMLVNG